MGTASLVLGIALIGAGFGYFLVAEASIYYYGPTSTITISIILIVIGALLLRKYDRDKKKTENS